MRSVRAAWEGISTIGLDESLDERLARRVKLTNQMTVVGCGFTTLQMLMFPGVPSYTFLCLFCALMYGATFFFMDWRYFDLGRLYFTACAALCISLSSGLLNDEPSISCRLILLQAFVLPLVIFDIREYRLFSIGILFFVISNLTLDTITEAIPKLEAIDPELLNNQMNVVVNSILVILCFVLGFRYLQRLNHQAEDKLAESILIEKLQREELEAKNRDIQDGIAYAQQIQEAILPASEDIRACLPDHFIFHRPKEKIGGDFFWFGEYGAHIVFAAIDCTGHGSPGALISIIGSKLLDRIVKEQGITAPSEILELLNIDVISTLSTEYKVLKDGMDISLVSIDTEHRDMRFAGAKSSLLLISEGHLNEIRGDRASVGDPHILAEGFKEQRVVLQKGDSIYMSSDGIFDQFGGADGRKWMKRNFKDALLRHSQYSMDLQLECLKKELGDWQRELEQVDDILVIGFRVDYEHISNVNRFRKGKPNGFAANPSSMAS